MTLTQICQHFWKLVAIMDGNQYELFQKFVVVTDHGLQAVAGAVDKMHPHKRIQDLLDEITLELVGYWGKLSHLDGNYDPGALMLEARVKDEEREREMISLNKLKKIPKLKGEVDFHVHEGTETHKLSLNISKQGTAEEVLFKLGKDPSVRVKLHENAFFYTGITWKGNNTKATHLELMSGTSTYRPKKRSSDFKEYFNSPNQGPVHVFIDRNPSIHILFTTRKWSRLYSLVGVIDEGKGIVLKGVDGTLYHAQQVAEKLIQRDAHGQYQVYRLNIKSGVKVWMEAGLKPSNCITALFDAHQFICVEDKRQPGNRWLVEIPFGLLEEEPIFDHWAKKPKIRYTGRPGQRIGLARPHPFDSSSTTGSASATSDATARVKAMVAQLEKQEAEKKEKEKNGIFSKIFGGKI